MKTIGEVAKLTGLASKTVRYYESEGLLSTVARADNGYRYYSAENIQELQFIQGAREAGFSIVECRELMALFHNSARRSAEVKQLTLEKVATIHQRIAQLQQMADHLQQLADQCHGDDAPECAILDGLADPKKNQ